MTGKRVVRGEVVEIVVKTVGVAAMIEGIVIEIGAEKAETVEMAEIIKEAEMGEIVEMVEKAEMVETPEIIEIAGIAEEKAGKEKT